VTQTIVFDVPGGPLGKLAGKAIVPRMRAELVNALHRQREVLEGEAATAPSPQPGI
jgi:hypothetical protein